MRKRSEFEALAMPHLPTVYRLARQMVGTDRAEDLAQDTYLKAWTHFGSFTPGTNCRAWLCRILHNTWISQWRKVRLELPVGDLDDLPQPGYDWEHEATRMTLSDDMQWALDQLPDAYRWAVLLADVEELTYQDIAATMDCPVGTVMSRISRGRRMLGRLLNERSRETTPPLRIVARER
ncbi:MAG: RNA polymerase sigma factor [Acidobacteria bacterium]|nr:RNA polymerase sigma factor [Acidobacteriota bacterium]